jgi:hypothetical protein
MYKYLAQHAGLEADLVQFEALYIAAGKAWDVIKLSRAAGESLRLANERLAKKWLPSASAQSCR